MKKEFIYADNGATTPLAPEALEAMLPFLKEQYANPSSLYSFGRYAKNAITEARKTIADCIGALPEEIFFTSGGSESNNWVIKSSMSYGSIVTSKIEHHSVLHSLSFCDHFPKQRMPKCVSVDSKGLISLTSLDSTITKGTYLVSVMMANNEIGTIEPIPMVAKIAHSHGALCHTDAVQAVGHIPLNVKTLDVDYLSASAHKFRGPKGAGFLYIKKEAVLDNFMDGGAQEYGVRAGTENVAAIVGMATALKISCSQMVQTNIRLKQMVDNFKTLITNAIPDVSFNGDMVNRIPGHISLSIPGISGEGLLHYLDLKGIAVSTGAACDSMNTNVSHVLNAIRLAKKKALGTIRITFGVENKEDEPQIIAKNIMDYVCKMRSKK